MHKINPFGAAALLSACFAAPAMAHVTIANEPVKPESSVTVVLQVPHGCDGKATIEVEVRLPEGFISAKPVPKPGWTLETVKGPYAKSYDNHGAAVTAGVTVVRWKGGNLPDEFFDTFAVNGKISGTGDQKALPFVTMQRCEGGATTAWDAIAKPGEDAHGLKNPAPVLKIGGAAPAADAHAGHGDHAAMDHGAAPAADDGAAFAPARTGEVELTKGFTKAMLPGQPVGGGFITLRNGGHHDDVLVSAQSPNAGRVELHEMAMEGTVMKMRQLKDGIPLPAGQTVELKPGGLHLMFMEVKTPFKEGETVPVTLTFKNAGTVSVKMPVVSARPGSN